MDLFPNIFAVKRTVSTGVVTTPSVITGAQYQYGTVGTYVIAHITVATVTTLAPGTTHAGSNLTYFDGTLNGAYTVLNMANQSAGTLQGVPGLNGFTVTSLGLSGTWRLLTYIENTSSGTIRDLAGLFVRIA